MGSDYRSISSIPTNTSGDTEIMQTITVHLRGARFPWNIHYSQAHSRRALIPDAAPNASRYCSPNSLLGRPGRFYLHSTLSC